LLSGLIWLSINRSPTVFEELELPDESDETRARDDPMTRQQGVERRPRRRSFMFLLALLPIAVAAAALSLPASPVLGAFAGMPGKVLFDDAVDETCDSGHIFTMIPDGSGRRELAVGAQGEFSPDGEEIVFTTCKPPYSQVSVMGADGSNPHQLIAGKHSVSAASFSPNGHSLVFVRFENSAGRPDVWTAHADGTHLRQLTATPNASETDPSYAPSGRFLLFSSGGSKRTSKFHIFTMRPSGVQLKNLGLGSEPSISPDGRLIVYVRDNGIWIMGSNGAAAHEIKAAGGPSSSPIGNRFDRNLSPTFSPNGKSILFAREPELRENGPLNKHILLWTMRLDGSHVQKIGVDLETAVDEFRPDWQAR
jgi:Tol biopolymer transport system component